MVASQNCTTSISEISEEEVIEAVCLTHLQRVGLTVSLPMLVDMVYRTDAQECR